MGRCSMSLRILTASGLLLLGGLIAVPDDDKVAHHPDLEKVPPEEAIQIQNITQLTIEQLKKRYPGNELVRRGVHPKDHGCVMAKFKVLETLPEELRVGVFSTPSREYQAWIRFSNAAVLVGPDSTSVHG